MEKTKVIWDVSLSPKNCYILTDDSCCLNNEEQQHLGVLEIPFMATVNQAEETIKSMLDQKEFVLFVGTAPSLSVINDTVRGAAKILDNKDKRLNARKRVIVLNTSCFSGGLGLFVTHFAEFFNSGNHTLNELKTYNLFLSNHIAHFFVEPNSKRWNELIYVPRTGPVNYSGGKFRGNKGVYNHLAGNFQDYAYNKKESVWICASSQKDEARILARQFKRCCPDSRVDLSHHLMPHSIASLQEDVVACFFLSIEVRPDEPTGHFESFQYREADRKNQFAKYNITEITRFAQAHKNSPCPEF